jgi:hypothetical protein
MERKEIIENKVDWSELRYTNNSELRLRTKWKERKEPKQNRYW